LISFYFSIHRSINYLFNYLFCSNRKTLAKVFQSNKSCREEI